MPCAASPPSTFCQDQVTTSSLSQGSVHGEGGRGRVADHQALRDRPRSSRRPATARPRWCRSRRTRRHASGRPRSAPAARRRAAVMHARIGELELLDDVGRPALGKALMRQHVDRPRAPSIDHSAISTAPVSEAGTMPSCQSAGMPSRARERLMTSAMRALGSAARWLRPSMAPDNASSEKPGRLAQGPDEKSGLLGRVAGRGMPWADAIEALPFRREAPRWGGVTRHRM